MLSRKSLIRALWYPVAKMKVTMTDHHDMS
jgi:hypothetical protein